VPRDSGDIRDSSAETFADVESRRFRARTAFIVAAILFGAAVVLVLVALVRVAGRVRKRQPGAAAQMPPALVLGSCVKGLNALRADVAREGWTPALARRAASMLRIAAAVALGKVVAQRPVANDAAEHEGQVVVRRGLVRRRQAAVSAATTPQAIDKLLDNGHRPGAAVRGALGQIRGSLHVLGSAGYGRASELDLLTLNTALEQGTDAVKQLRLRSLLPKWARL
jgi:hypothetical protein